MTIYRHIVGWASAVLEVGPTSPTTAAATSSPARPGWAPRGCRIQASATATAARTGSTAAFSIAAHAPASTVVGVQIKSAILLYRSKYQQQASSSSK